MKTKLKINTLLDKIPQDAVYIPTGLTNDNYIVSLDESKYVVRLPKANNSHLFDYVLESKIIKSIHHLNLDVETLYYDSNTGIKVSPFIEGAKHFVHSNVTLVSSLLRRLHDANIQCNKRYDIKHQFNQYYQEIKNPLFDLEPFRHYIQSAFDLSSDWRLCHNDVVPGNILITEEKTYLIDYEYACDNDPIFDVMSFITENNINSDSVREEIYSTYFQIELTPSLRFKLFTFECALNTLWCAWAMRMFEVESKEVFKKIAIDKYLNLLKAIRISDFD